MISPPADSSPQQDWVLWDGSCGFCAYWARWVERRDTGGRFRVVPYQSAPPPPLTEVIRERAPRAVQVLTTDGRRLEAGRGVLHVLVGLGYGWARWLGVPPLVWGVEMGYRLVAANRGRLGRWFGAGVACG